MIFCFRCNKYINSPKEDECEACKKKEFCRECEKECCTNEYTEICENCKIGEMEYMWDCYERDPEQL